jgi:uncharacterized protein (DUF952 family)
VTRPATVLHLALLADWDRAQDAGRYDVSTRGLTLQQVGFVHASEPHQVDGVARAFYADVTEPMVLLELDVAALGAAGSPVRWEDVPGAPDPFPHVYGPVPVAAVVDVTPYRLPT